MNHSVVRKVDDNLNVKTLFKVGDNTGNSAIFGPGVHLLTLIILTMKIKHLLQTAGEK